jgi:hypothetical protein
VAVKFLINDALYPPSKLYEFTGVQLSAQLAGGVYTVVKGVGLQLLLQKAANSLYPAPQSMPPDMLWAVVRSNESIGTPRPAVVLLLGRSATRGR